MTRLQQIFDATVACIVEVALLDLRIQAIVKLAQGEATPAGAFITTAILKDSHHLGCDDHASLESALSLVNKHVEQLLIGDARVLAQAVLSWVSEWLLKLIDDVIDEDDDMLLVGDLKLLPVQFNINFPELLRLLDDRLDSHVLLHKSLTLLKRDATLLELNVTSDLHGNGIVLDVEASLIENVNADFLLIDFINRDFDLQETNRRVVAILRLKILGVNFCS